VTIEILDADGQYASISTEHPKKHHNCCGGYWDVSA
jgi:hypothetical protein